jgi:N-acetylneuraminic acid mutarotase
VLIYSSGFSSDDKCYVAGGEGEMGKESLFMSFDGKEWSTMGSFGEIRKKSSSFVLNGSFYLVCGENDVNAPQKSVLKYSIK